MSSQGATQARITCGGVRMGIGLSTASVMTVGAVAGGVLGPRDSCALPGEWEPRGDFFTLRALAGSSPKGRDDVGATTSVFSVAA